MTTPWRKTHPNTFTHTTDNVDITTTNLASAVANSPTHPLIMTDVCSKSTAKHTPIPSYNSISQTVVPSPECIQSHADGKKDSNSVISFCHQSHTNNHNKQINVQNYDNSNANYKTNSTTTGITTNSTVATAVRTPVALSLISPRRARQPQTQNIQETIRRYESEVALLPHNDNIKWYKSKRGFNVTWGGQSKWFSVHSRGVRVAYEMATEWLCKQKELTGPGRRVANMKRGNSNTVLQSFQNHANAQHNNHTIAISEDANRIYADNTKFQGRYYHVSRRHPRTRVPPRNQRDGMANGCITASGHEATANNGIFSRRCESLNVLSDRCSYTEFIDMSDGDLVDSEDTAEEVKKMPKVPGICWVPQKNAFSVFYWKGTNKTTKAFNPVTFGGVKKAFKAAYKFSVETMIQKSNPHTSHNSGNGSTCAKYMHTHDRDIRERFRRHSQNAAIGRERCDVFNDAENNYGACNGHPKAHIAENISISYSHYNRTKTGLKRSGSLSKHTHTSNKEFRIKEMNDVNTSNPQKDVVSKANSNQDGVDQRDKLEAIQDKGSRERGSSKENSNSGSNTRASNILSNVEIDDDASSQTVHDSSASSVSSQDEVNGAETDCASSSCDLCAKSHSYNQNDCNGVTSLKRNKSKQSKTKSSSRLVRCSVKYQCRDCKWLARMKTASGVEVVTPFPVSEYTNITDCKRNATLFLNHLKRSTIALYASQHPQQEEPYENLTEPVPASNSQ